MNGLLFKPYDGYVNGNRFEKSEYITFINKESFFNIDVKYRLCKKENDIYLIEDMDNDLYLSSLSIYENDTFYPCDEYYSLIDNIGIIPDDYEEHLYSYNASLLKHIQTDENSIKDFIKDGHLIPLCEKEYGIKNFSISEIKNKCIEIDTSKLKYWMDTPVIFADCSDRTDWNLCYFKGVISGIWVNEDRVYCTISFMYDGYIYFENTSITEVYIENELNPIKVKKLTKKNKKGSNIYFIISALITYGGILYLNSQYGTFSKQVIITLLVYLCAMGVLYFYACCSTKKKK